MNGQNKMNILGFVGSLRQGSYNKMLMQAFMGSLPAEARMEIAEIGNLPLYNTDLEADFPKEASKLKAKIKAADAIIISTPEFNRSISGVLKNALDWTSRPYGDNAWAGKRVLVVGASTGAIGTALGQYHLKQILLYLDARVLGQPEFYCGMAKSKFDANGKLIDEPTKEHITKALSALLNS